MISNASPNGPAGRAALRRALLQRIADRLAYARAFEAGEIDAGPFGACCWLTYSWPTEAPYWYAEHRFLHRLCDRSCPHWHHLHEVLLA